VVGEWKGDMDIEKELSSDEDDFDGLDMHVWNHTEAFLHRKEGICLACSAYMHLKGGSAYNTIQPKKRAYQESPYSRALLLRFSACKVRFASWYSCLGRW
jgi:hypothetical protein